LLIVAKFIPFFDRANKCEIERLFGEEMVKFIRFRPHCAAIGPIIVAR